MDRTLSDDGEDQRIVLNLLRSVEEGAGSQRRIAEDLGIALGLVNAYLKRCVKKGLVKVSEAPARRYAYYLTPQGFAEKSRLTVEYLSYSFSFFRRAKADCAQLFADAVERKLKNLVLVGKSDLAEIAILCAVDWNVSIVAVIDSSAEMPQTFAGIRMVSDLSKVSDKIDAVVITGLVDSRQLFQLAIERYGLERVLVPRLLEIHPAIRQDELQ